MKIGAWTENLAGWSGRGGGQGDLHPPVGFWYTCGTLVAGDSSAPPGHTSHREESIVKKVCAIVMACGMAAAANAQESALIFDNFTGTVGGVNNQCVGWQFDVVAEVTVIGLSWADLEGDGLVRDHPVGIWDPAGTLLASIRIPAGTSAPLMDQFRWVEITPITLQPGVGYIVGGETFSLPNDPFRWNVASQTTHPSIVFFDATFSAIGSGLVRPASFSSAVNGFYGPSFVIGEGGCYADCDTSTGVGVLDIFDFLCFGNRFDAGDPYACDCDTSTGMGVCDIFDFLCFGNAFNAGCP